ncbi:hypothetical protein MMC34_005634 [Xylographa carneopallida]|nr:hypothetical protein [Xylographa carneopallida]
MCRLIWGEKHCDNCDEILEPYFIYCNSIGSYAEFAHFVHLDPSYMAGVAKKDAEWEQESLQSQAAALLCRYIEDGKRKVSPEDTAVMNAAGWTVTETKVREELWERVRRLSLLDEREKTDKKQAGGGG